MPLHHFSARSKCSSRPNSHQKALKRNRQKPEKKGTQWLKSGDFHIFLIFSKQQAHANYIQLVYSNTRLGSKNDTIFSPRTVAGSPQDQCPHNGAHAERTTETFGRAAAKANGNLPRKFPGTPRVHEN